MKYTFKPITALAVAGLAASAYACFYQTNTAATCFFSGNTIDKITWYDSGTSLVTATSDFIINSYANAQSSTTGSTKYASVTALYCAGPAKFTDRAGHVNNVTYWEADSVAFNNYPPSIPSGSSLGSLSGTCM